MNIGNMDKFTEGVLRRAVQLETDLAKERDENCTLRNRVAHLEKLLLAVDTKSGSLEDEMPMHKD